MAASRDRGYGVEFARHNRYNESRQCDDTLYNGSAQVTPLSTCLQMDQLKSVHPGPKQMFPIYALGSCTASRLMLRGHKEFCTNHLSVQDYAQETRGNSVQIT